MAARQIGLDGTSTNMLNDCSLYSVVKIYGAGIAWDVPNGEWDTARWEQYKSAVSTHFLPQKYRYITYWEKYKTIHYRGFIRKLIPLRFTCDENKMQIGAKTLNTQPSTSLMLMNLSPEHDMKMFFAPLHMDERGQLLQCDRQEFKSESRIFWTQNSDSMDSQIRANLRQSIAN